MHILAILALVQLPWNTTLPSRGLALNFLRPKFDGGGTSLTSGAASLSGRFPIGGGLSLRLEAPFAHMWQRSPPGPRTGITRTRA